MLEKTRDLAQVSVHRVEKSVRYFLRRKICKIVTYFENGKNESNLIK